MPLELLSRLNEVLLCSRGFLIVINEQDERRGVAFEDELLGLRRELGHIRQSVQEDEAEQVVPSERLLELPSHLLGVLEVVVNQ